MTIFFPAFMSLKQRRKSFNKQSMSSYVLNPRTQRPIKTSGRVYQALVREGVLEDTEIDHERVLSNENTREDIRSANRRLPKNKQAVRGRGRFANTVVWRYLPRKWEEEEEEDEEEEEESD